jgi:hypothetical protein
MKHDTKRPRRVAAWALPVASPVLALSAGLALLLGGAGVAGATSSQPGGASGKVATLGAASMEVQNPSTGQTTVNWSTTTTFSRTVTETVSAVSVGECVSVTGTPSKKSKTTIAAGNITIRPMPASGTCTSPSGHLGGVGGPVRNFRSGGGSGFGAGGETFAKGGGPGAPNGGGFPRRAANFDLASGKVTAVSGSTLTVSGVILNATTRPKSTSSKSKSQSKASTPAPQKIKVTTSKSTTLTATQLTTASALAVGDCVTAFGQVASTGAVTAQTVSIDATNASGTCVGPGGFFGGAVPVGGGPVGGQVTSG